jgi:hypothetical protein
MTAAYRSIWIGAVMLPVQSECLEECAVRQIYCTDRCGIKVDFAAFPLQSIFSRILRKISARFQSAAFGLISK